MSGHRRSRRPEGTAATVEIKRDVTLPPTSETVSSSVAVVDQFTRIHAEEQRRIDDVRKIYPARESASPFNAAMTLLQSAVDSVAEARDSLRANDLIGADDNIQHLQALLPELFCFREIGDGFAAIINALLQAFRNLEGRPMNHAQVEATGRALRGLLFEPFLTHEEATTDIIMLEDAGLVTEPPELQELVDQ